MKRVSLFLAAAFLFVVTASANTTEPAKVAKQLSGEIHSMLEGNSFKIEKDLTANVKFTINAEGEIVVLSVETADAALESFVKGRLNYQKVDVQNVVEGRYYTVPVRIEA
ncbi:MULTISPECIES: hypothetical protein [Flavobacteriaceae]|uniref:hypothetical protein n=1 Tax=Flavobacteriaceae TaxID=49546 RepID=UPI0010AEC81A|nr:MULTISPECIES: hypothetical protein [Flavobacteriaceae]NJB37507.1 hypothetical protein [Croceivirga sp. JEA036]TKD61331.1 hypothetical protein FBT53_11135 [Flavobacterium sp. ASW18X]